MRILTTGFETGDIDYEMLQQSGGATVQSTQARNGTYSMRVTANNYGEFMMGEGLAEIYLGFGIYFDSNWSNYTLMSFYGVSDLLFNLFINASQQLVLRRGTTQLATSVQSFSAGQWYYIEVYYKADNVAGECTAKVDGTQWVTFSGDTINATETEFIKIRLTSQVNYTYYDDVIINTVDGSYNNSWPGQPTLALATVNGAGTNSQFTPSAGNNYQCVDEIPVSEADYVSSNQVGQVDTYHITNPLSGSNTEAIKNVIVHVISKVDKGQGNLDVVVLSAGTQDNSDPVGLYEFTQIAQNAWPLNPKDGEAWYSTDIDNLQVGQEVS